LVDSSDNEDSSEVGNSHECDDAGNDGDESKSNSDSHHPVASTNVPPFSPVSPPLANNRTPPSSAAVDCWNSKTNAFIKKECQRRGLAVSGNKDKMVAIIIADKKRPVASRKEPPISSVLLSSTHNKTPSLAVVDWNSKTNEML
jgi:hypothetical protein